MKERWLLILLGVALGGLPLGAARVDEEAGQELSQAGVQAAFQILRRDFIRSRELTVERLSATALEGLLAALDVGAQVVTVAREKEGETVEPQVHALPLAEGVGWVRPVTFAQAEVELVEKALLGFAKAGCKAVILDLRSPAREGGFEVAAAVLDLFLPGGETVFRMRQAGAVQGEVFVSSRPAVWGGDLLVLVDERTNNVGEAVAAVLQHFKRAILLGGRTKGAAVRYETLPLDAAHALRYASAEMLLPDGTAIYQKGIVPDFEVPFEGESRERTERFFERGRARELVFEQARPRFNEAALVARRNPEIDSYLRRSLGEVDAADKAVLVDPVMQRGVDLILGSERLQRFKLKWATEPFVKPLSEQMEAVPKGIPVTNP